MTAPLGLYLHVPFCRTRCRYCDFYRVGERREWMDDFVAALHREIDGWSDLAGRPVDTIFFGGGTPSLLAPEEIGGLLAHLASRFSVRADAEVSAESNPSDLSAERLAGLRAAGINRLSLGVQSLADRELALLGRRHDAASAVAAIERARCAGFDNLSFDLMLAIPGQTEASFARTLELAVALAPEHMSLYLLEVHATTEMDLLRRERPGLFPGEEAARRRYLRTIARLEAAGLAHYEISNFARPGRECRHNLKYWRREPYLGLGPSAHSCLEGGRFRHPADLRRWLANPNAIEPLESDAASERAFLGLRLAEGVPLAWVEAARSSGSAGLEVSLTRLSGLVRRDGGRVRLTPEGFVVSNAVMAELLA